MFLDEIKHQYVTLPKAGTWPQADHSFEPDSLWAINAALASHRPLLVQGEPGTGKSQLARAAAAALGRVPLSYVVNARTESRDLQYHYDALARLAEAQTATLSHGKETDAQKVLAKLHPRHFLEPGVLWWAFNWTEAKTQHGKCHSRGEAPILPDDAILGDKSHVKAKVENGVVVLIDEIDKADADVPNGLLETLGNGGFSVPYINQSVNATDPFPLVVVTTNGDRELPPAFLRRCVILEMAFPTKSDEFIQRLSERGRQRYGDALDKDRDKFEKDPYVEVAEKLWYDREKALKSQLTGPGQAEYFDMLEALVNLKGSQKLKPGEALAKLRNFIFRKYARGKRS